MPAFAPIFSNSNQRRTQTTHVSLHFLFQTLLLVNFISMWVSCLVFPCWSCYQWHMELALPRGNGFLKLSVRGGRERKGRRSWTWSLQCPCPATSRAVLALHRWSSGGGRSEGSLEKFSYPSKHKTISYTVDRTARRAGSLGQARPLVIEWNWKVSRHEQTKALNNLAHFFNTHFWLRAYYGPSTILGTMGHSGEYTGVVSVLLGEQPKNKMITNCYN